MNLDAITTSVESALEAQLRFASDGSVAEAGQALITALGPALRDAGMQLARQAAEWQADKPRSGSPRASM